MNILGVDPGLATTGYGLIQWTEGNISLIEAGIIKTPSSDHIDKRLNVIHKSLEELIDKNCPEVMVLEKIYSHYKHPATSILMGHARGVICLLCGQKNIRLVNYPSTRIKKAITGSGHASKVQIQKMIAERLRLKKLPEYADITDALSLAVGFVQIDMMDIKKFRGIAV